MKKIINYEKDIPFKSSIYEVCSIELEHDFTLDDDTLKGEFILKGEYRTNELSINTDDFLYRLPLEYELEKEIDRDSLSFDVDNFEYYIKGDTLNVIIDFGVRYEMLKKEPPIIPIISEEEINMEELELPKMVDETVEKVEERKVEDTVIEESSLVELDDDYMVYHVHVVGEGETLESIAIKYHSSVDVIKAYNNVDTLELKSKLIIPEEK